MSNCKNVCTLCRRLILSQAINFDGTNLIIDLPAGAYNSGEKYCIVFAQAIPPTTTIGAEVVFTIGGGAVQYPFTTKNCRPVTACGVRTRTKYSVCVVTTATAGTFRMLGKPCCCPDNSLLSIDGTVPDATAGGGAAG